MHTPLPLEVLEALRRIDSCTVANAIETFALRLRNEGFASDGLDCLFPNRAPVVGYGVTARIHTSNPPVKGRAYLDRTDWWQYILSVPAPRVVVIQDADETPGFGAFVGEVHANILQALGAAAIVTNGAVRDRHALQNTRLQILAGGCSVSHAYAHLVEFGEPVEIHGLKVQTGDLLHLDAHGMLSVPVKIAAEIPRVAADIQRRESRVIELCRSLGFSLDTLGDAVKGIFPDHRPSSEETSP